MADAKTVTEPPAEPAVDPLAEIRERIADIATVIATQPAPSDPTARLAHTRLSLFADAHAEAQRQERALREAAEREKRNARTASQLAAEGRAALAAR